MEIPRATENRLIRPAQTDLITNSKRVKLYHDDDRPPTTRLARENYTVGCIAALSLEMRAARAMLDEIHDDTERRKGDNNTYIFGGIAGHNCVIACLPAGKYATTSATVVASEMRFSFPNIEFWLMVGVGVELRQKMQIYD
jgi:nucleoside phosphorylase